ncbi:MAG: hypothetical protein EOP05_02820 [Proteobacteria bacterium]|nr:MAG: hypothetical protein EOP05_02820 [Pseudomonadota bacterium]
MFRWSIFLPTAAAASLISFSLTELGLRQRSTLLPDIANLGNELWVLIFLYLYSALNAFLAQSSHLAKDKKRAYVEHRYAYLTKKFGTYISSLNLSSELNRLMYSVMIVESFNRPGIFRAAERRLVAVLRRPVSQGIMQVSSSTVLSDQQSINLASEILKTSYERVLTKTIEANPDYSKSTDEWKMNFLKSRVLERTIWFYNNSDDYVADVKAVNDLIAEIESEKSSVKLSKEELFAIRLDAFDGAVE